jgi:hypothetical protein
MRPPPFAFAREHHRHVDICEPPLKEADMEEKNKYTPTEQTIDRPGSGTTATQHADDSTPTGERPPPPTPETRGHLATRKPLKKVAFKVFLRWLTTVVFAVAIAGVLVAYARKPVLSRDDKRQFNAIITGLSIGFSLVMVSCLDGMVSELRWWVLSRRHRSRRKVRSPVQVTGGGGDTN